MRGRVKEMTTGVAKLKKKQEKNEIGESRKGGNKIRWTRELERKGK